MFGPIFDFNNGDMIFQTSDNTGINSDGDIVMRMGDNMAMDMDTGDIHMVSGWGDDDGSKNGWNDDLF